MKITLRPFLRQSGFTILEVVLSMSILMSLALFATQMIRNGLDMRSALSTQARVNQRLTQALYRIVTDLENVFVLNMSKDARLNPISRSTKTLFRTRLEGKSHELALTTMTHRPLNANAHESDQTFVIYKLVAQKDAPEVTDLQRGETKILPQNFRDEVAMRSIAKNIKSLVISTWNGERWDKDRWDSSASDWRDRLPQMIMVEIEGWEEDELPAEGLQDAPTKKLNTIVYLPQAANQKELRDRSQNIKWY